MNPISKRKIAKYLPCSLTDDERLSFGDDLAEASQAVDNVMNRKKFVLTQLQTEIKAAEARRDKLAGIVGSKVEYREVTVEVELNYETGKYRETRTDTGEIVADRLMTDEEKQVSMLEMPGVVD